MFSRDTIRVEVRSDAAPSPFAISFNAGAGQTRTVFGIHCPPRSTAVWRTMPLSVVAHPLSARYMHVPTPYWSQPPQVRPGAHVICAKGGMQPQNG